MPDYSELSIIIPTINEKDNLQTLLPDLAGLYPGAHIFIADDGSDDGTDRMISNMISKGFPNPIYLMQRGSSKILYNSNTFDVNNYISDKLNIRSIKGLTSSVIDALSIIQTENFTVIDADYQHPPMIIEGMFEKLSEAPLVCAYRTKLDGFPLHRKLLTWTGTFLARSSLPRGRTVKDPLSGAFAGSKDIRSAILADVSNFRLEGFKVLYDILSILGPDIKTAQYGYEFRMRKFGKSKIGFSQLLSFFNAIFRSPAK